MPLYVFKCETCGEHTRKKSIHDNLSRDSCPTCSEETKRVYTPFMTNTLDRKLSKAIETGMEPKVMKKNEIPKSNLKQKTKNPRPWMN